MQTMQAIDRASAAQAALRVRFACLTHDLVLRGAPGEDAPADVARQTHEGGLLSSLCDRVRVPRDCQDLAQLVAFEHRNINASLEVPGSALAALLARCDAFRQPERFEAALLACALYAGNHASPESHAHPPSERLGRALRYALAVDTRLVARASMQAGQRGEQIGHAIHAARIDAINSGENAPTH